VRALTFTTFCQVEGKLPVRLLLLASISSICRQALQPHTTITLKEKKRKEKKRKEKKRKEKKRKEKKRKEKKRKEKKRKEKKRKQKKRKQKKRKQKKRKEKKRKEKKRKEKKRKEKTTPFGVSLLRSPVLYRAAHSTHA